MTPSGGGACARSDLACRVSPASYLHPATVVHLCLVLLLTMDFSQMNAAEQAHMSKVIEKKQVRRVCCAHVRSETDRCTLQR